VKKKPFAICTDLLQWHFYMAIHGCTFAGFPTLNGLMISKNRMKVTRNKGKQEQAEEVGKKDKGTVELRNDVRVSLSDKLMAVATLDRSH